ncbi:MAG: hypothetical protein ACJ0GH_02660 [Alphaproteobacteria bacterium]
MTTQELYNKVLAEEVTQQKFLYEVRRDINLPFITSNNNFKDTVKILKNKGIISEKKLSTGKQEVEIFAKTIDMVNPYEYTRGMNYELDVVVDAMGNRIADNAGDSMHIEDLTKDDVLKAQKKVLKNLTKNPQHYQQLLIPQMEGETEYAIEVTAKSIEALKKKAGKVIREHGEDYEAVSKVMGNVSQLEEDDKTQEFVMALDMFKNAKGTSDEKKAREYLKKISKQSIGVELPIDTDMDGDVDNMDEQQMRIPFNKDLSFREKSKILNQALADYRNAKGTKAKKAKEELVKVAQGLGAKITMDDLLEKDEKNEYGTGVKEDEQIAAKKMAAKREEIYEKYANEYGVDVNEIKDRLEAYKLEKEAIEVEDEDTAISVQKKSPDADVRIIEK